MGMSQIPVMPRSVLVAETPRAIAPPASNGLRRPDPERRDTAFATRAAVASTLLAEPAAAGEGMDRAYVPVLPVEPVPSVERAPLPSVPVPGAGEAGIGAAASQSGTFPIAQTSADAWWSGPVELGDRTGAAASSAGRATASFVKRVGSSVPRVFAH